MTGNRRIVAVVLAAGLASRFGGDKLIYPYRGKPLAAHIADTLASLSLDHRIAIAAPAHPARRTLFEERGFEVLDNPDPGRGMASSLALAAGRAIGLDVDAMLVCLADMPDVTVEHLLRIIRTDVDAVTTESNGVRSPPAVFGRSLLPQLTTLTGDKGAREQLRAAATVTASPQMVRDFDTPEDFAG